MDYLKDRIYYRILKTQVIIYECFNYTILIVPRDRFNSVMNKKYLPYENGTYCMDLEKLNELNGYVIDFHNINISEIKSPMVICLDIIGKCNMKCLYCIANNKPKEEKNILTIIEKLNCNHDFLSILINGGEPLLYKLFPSIVKLIDTSNKAVMIDTNGTLIHTLDANILALIADKFITLRISLDSCDSKINNKLRGKTDYVLNALEICKEHNIDLRINTVISNVNIGGLDVFAEYLIEKKIKNWTLFRLIKFCSFYDVLSVDEDYEQEIVKNLIKKYKADIFIYYNPHIEVPDSLFRIDQYGDCITETNQLFGSILNSSIGEIWEDNFNKFNHVKRYVQHKGLYI